MPPGRQRKGYREFEASLGRCSESVWEGKGLHKGRKDVSKEKSSHRKSEGKNKSEKEKNNLSHLWKPLRELLRQRR